MSTTRKSATAKRTQPGPDAERLVAAYSSAALIRAADEKAVELSRAGRTGLVVPATGCEVLLGGTAAAMRADDWALPGVRQSPIALARGLAPVSWFSQILGRIADPSRGRQEPYHPSVASLNVFSVSTTPGTQLVHATGVGRAMARAGRGAVAVALCGEASVATDSFHTGVNFAAVWQAPVVFVVTRGSRFGLQTASESVAIKARAYDLPAIEIDGADLPAVLEAVETALARARSGGGPTLIDARCPDAPAQGPAASGPRSMEAEAEAWAENDPLARAAALVSDAEALTDKARLAVEEGANAALALPPPPVETLFEDVFARRTPALDAQRASRLRRP
jgi:TPP-dependent pyruvate/acetoin dehydrogenase alpha subunit